MQIFGATLHVDTHDLINVVEIHPTLVVNGRQLGELMFVALWRSARVYISCLKPIRVFNCLDLKLQLS